jgi:hypothetical protein
MCAPFTGQQAERYVRPLAIATMSACIRLRTESMTGTGRVLSLSSRFKALGAKPDLPLESAKARRTCLITGRGPSSVPGRVFHFIQCTWPRLRSLECSLTFPCIAFRANPRGCGSLGLPCSQLRWCRHLPFRHLPTLTTPLKRKAPMVQQR